MSGESNNQNPKRKRNAYDAGSNGSIDPQETPAYGFPTVSGDKQAKSGKGGNTANAARPSAAANSMKGDSANYDFLWEDDKQRRSAKGDAGTTTVVESDTDYLLLPHPDIFNAYPPEVQRKIMEWADRDVRARRDDESLRQDALVRARAARERTAVTVPVAIIILCIVCAAVTGIVTRSAVFVIAFLAIAFAIILSVYFTKKNDLFALYDDEEEEESEEE